MTALFGLGIALAAIAIVCGIGCMLDNVMGTTYGAKSGDLVVLAPRDRTYIANAGNFHPGYMKVCAILMLAGIVFMLASGQGRAEQAEIKYLSGFIPVTDWYEGPQGQCKPGYSELTPLLPNGLVICGKRVGG